jgi:hypothetical protein
MKKQLRNTRADNELPEATVSWGWKYHHTGIPTRKKREGETYLSRFMMYISGFGTSPFGIEWMRFEKSSPVNELIQKVPHIAFEVECIEHEVTLHRLKVITPPNEPGEGIRVAMVEHNGAPVELIEFHNFE